MSMSFAMSTTAIGILKRLFAAAGSSREALRLIVEDSDFAPVEIKTVQVEMRTECADEIRSMLSQKGVPKGLLTSRSIEAWLLLHGKKKLVTLREHALQEAQEFEPDLCSGRYQSGEEAHKVVTRHARNIRLGAGRKRKRQTERQNAMADAVQSALDDSTHALEAASSQG
jgi:hypothetical protein